jgi:hypothetical protein
VGAGGNDTSSSTMTAASEVPPQQDPAKTAGARRHPTPYPAHPILWMLEMASSSNKGAGTKAEKKAQRKTDAKALEDEEVRQRFMSREDVRSAGACSRYGDKCISATCPRFDFCVVY